MWREFRKELKYYEHSIDNGINYALGAFKIFLLYAFINYKLGTLEYKSSYIYKVLALLAI